MDQVKRKVELSILYLSQDNQVSFIGDFLDGKDILDPSEYEPKVFWGCSGGLEILVNDYQVVFRSTDFHFLIKVVSFLLHCLYKIENKTSSWFDEESSGDVIVYTTSSYLLIVKVDNDKVQISYLNRDKEASNKIRRDRFFENIIFQKQDFYDATHLALSEYFAMLENIMNDFPENSTLETIKAYLQVWEEIR